MFSVTLVDAVTNEILDEDMSMKTLPVTGDTIQPLHTKRWYLVTARFCSMTPRKYGDVWDLWVVPGSGPFAKSKR
jgi:hypothetical protein